MELRSEFAGIAESDVLSRNGNPFPGLRSFSYREHPLFFGREKNIRELLTKLDQNHFVAIVGTSGTGKSSLIRAGLLPALHAGKSNGTDWLIASMKPGNTPLENLADALASKHVFGTGAPEHDGTVRANILGLISQSSLGLVQAVRSLLNGRRLLILVDQFEELFRFSDDHNERNNVESSLFANLIIDSVRQRDIPIYIMLTLRSDFLGDCVRFEGLPEAINDGHYLVPRLTKDQNRGAITGPVEFAKGKISPRLVQRVIQDLGDNPDQLPVLQHALMRTWDSWREHSEQGEPMDLRHYEMIGGMQHALSNHADEAFKELHSEKSRKLIGQVLKCLTVKQGDNRGVRRPTSVERLLEITQASFEEFTEALQPFRKKGRSFILPDESGTLAKSTILDISHESLMRGWERLHTWVDEEKESAGIYERLCTGMLLHKQGHAGLWRDPELQLALDWKAKNNPNPAWASQYNSHFDGAMNFLSLSAADSLSEKRRKLNRRRIVRTAVASFLIVVSILSAWALFQQKKATEKSVLAEQKTTEALNQKQLAEKAKEMALAASRQAMDAKSYAELQASIAGEQKKMADEQKIRAVEEAERATTQEREASRQKQLAEQKSREALSEKQKADSANSEATRLRLLSIGQNLAFKSLQQKDDAQLAGLLAWQSYKMVSTNNGNVNDPQLYNASLAAAQKVDASFSPIVIRNVSAAGLRATGNSISAIADNGTVRSFSGSDFGESGSTKIIAGANSAYFDDHGRMAAVGLDNNTALVFDPSGSSQQTLNGHDGLVRAVAFSKDGSLLATGARDSTLILWKGTTLIKKNRLGSRIRALAFHPTQNTVVAGTEDGNVFLCGTDGDEKKIATHPGARVQAIQFTQSGRIFVACSNGQVDILSSAGQLVKTWNEPGSADFLSIDEKNDLLVVATSGRLLHLYRLSDLSAKPIEINCGGNVNAVATTGGEFVYVACADRTIRRYPVQAAWFERIFKAKIARNLTPEEWKAFVGSDVPYAQ